MIIIKVFFFYQAKVLGKEKKRLNETFLLHTQTLCY